MKRLFDLSVAVTGLLVMAPLVLLIACIIRLTSRGPVFFRQERVGRNFRRFQILKFRTMVADAPRRGSQVTFGNDPRITPIGRILRKLKLDELPQLINVFLGEMSLVGPRPEVPRYVEMFADDYAEILKVRPGITDTASIVYRDEATLLGQAADPEKEYTTRVLPEKIRLGREYVAHRSFWLDLKLIVQTVLAIAGRGPAPR